MITFEQAQQFNVAFEEESVFFVTEETDPDFYIMFETGVGMDCQMEANEAFNVGFMDFVPGTEIYRGRYEVTPTAAEQQLLTTDKKLLQNVTVHATPYSEVSNPEGGSTVTI